jgi:hypothetical protein
MGFLWIAPRETLPVPPDPEHISDAALTTISSIEAGGFGNQVLTIMVNCPTALNGRVQVCGRCRLISTRSSYT